MELSGANPFFPSRFLDIAQFGGGAIQGPSPSANAELEKPRYQEKDLLKKTLLEIERKVQGSGRKILEEISLLAFTAPVPFIDWVFGKPSFESFQMAKSFFGEKPFKWRVSEEDDRLGLMEMGFKESEREYEMAIYLRTLDIPEVTEGISIRPVISLQEYSQWVTTSANAWNLDPVMWDRFFLPWIKTEKIVPYIAFFNGEPAATSLLYLGEKDASLWSIGTRPDFRRQGLGTAVTRACLQEAKKNGYDWAVLSASEMGRPMYEKIGFQFQQVIHDYSSP
jgi:GNAT superfamily N-acetyltransferase